MEVLSSHGCAAHTPPTGDGDHAGWRHLDDVVSRKALRVGGVRVGDEGADAAPRRQHVATPNVHVGAQIVANLLQNELDLRLCKNDFFHPCMAQ